MQHLPTQVKTSATLKECRTFVNTWGRFYAYFDYGNLTSLRHEPIREHTLFHDVLPETCDFELYPDRSRYCHISQQIHEFLTGQRQAFDLSIDPPIEPGQRRVLRYVRTIPYGKTVTYGLVASAIDCPSAVDQVIEVLKRNVLPFIYPCHRVIMGQYDLGPYKWGTEMKRQLLTLEALYASGLKTRNTS